MGGPVYLGLFVNWPGIQAIRAPVNARLIYGLRDEVAVFRLFTMPAHPRSIDKGFEHARVIPCAISRNPADINLADLPLSCNHQTHIKTTFPPYRADALVIAKKQNRMTANAFRLKMLMKALLCLLEVENWETVGQSLSEGRFSCYIPINFFSF